jgi:hypothetical protein
LNEGTHTITNTLKVGSGQGEETWKGIVVNFHDLSILGQGAFNNLKNKNLVNCNCVTIILK